MDTAYRLMPQPDLTPLCRPEYVLRIVFFFIRSINILIYVGLWIYRAYCLHIFCALPVTEVQYIGRPISRQISQCRRVSFPKLAAFPISCLIFRHYQVLLNALEKIFFSHFLLFLPFPVGKELIMYLGPKRSRQLVKWWRRQRTWQGYKAGPFDGFSSATLIFF